jgi:hypothetical protein
LICVENGIVMRNGSSHFDAVSGSEFMDRVSVFLAANFVCDAKHSFSIEFTRQLCDAPAGLQRFVIRLQHNKQCVCVTRSAATEVLQSRFQIDNGQLLCVGNDGGEQLTHGGMRTAHSTRTCVSHASQHQQLGIIGSVNSKLADYILARNLELRPCLAALFGDLLQQIARQYRKLMHVGGRKSEGEREIGIRAMIPEIVVFPDPPLPPTAMITLSTSIARDFRRRHAAESAATLLFGGVGEGEGSHHDRRAGQHQRVLRDVREADAVHHDRGCDAR